MSLSIRVPGSKSMTQRALVIAALAERPATLLGALPCDDSALLSALLAELGVAVEWDGERVEVTPAPLRASGEVLFCGNGGTAMRFGSCLSLLAEGELTLDGDARMRERPIGPLGLALEQLGVRVRYLGQHGCPPLALQRQGPAPTRVTVDASLSSQFGSGLLLVAPRLPRGLTVALEKDPVSLPYLRMTTRMMERAGVTVCWTDERTATVEPGLYLSQAVGQVLEVEPDWSSAAFLLAAARVSQVELVIPGLADPASSLQGDSVFAGFLEELRRPLAHEIDLSHCPDLIAPLVATCLFASHPTRIRGAAHTRVKESDRIAVLCRELGKIGAQFVEVRDGMDVFPLQRIVSAEVELDPSADHRMAMAFGVVSLRVPGIRVRDPRCVTKSYPGFWPELERFRAQVALGEVS